VVQVHTKTLHIFSGMQKAISVEIKKRQSVWPIHGGKHTKFLAKKHTISYWKKKITEVCLKNQFPFYGVDEKSCNNRSSLLREIFCKYCVYHSNKSRTFCHKATINIETNLFVLQTRIKKEQRLQYKITKYYGHNVHRMWLQTRQQYFYHNMCSGAG